MVLHYECSACGAKFSTPIGEARHRHNFPALCKRNKRFKAWQRQIELDRVAETLERFADIAEIALPQFDWGRSALSGKAISALNDVPDLEPVRKMIERLRTGEI